MAKTAAPKKKATRALNVEVPVALKGALEAYCKRTGRKMNWVVVQAVGDYINKSEA